MFDKSAKQVLVITVGLLLLGSFGLYLLFSFQELYGPILTPPTMMTDSNILPTPFIPGTPTLPSEDHLRPKDVPVVQWKSIPVMPLALAGHEYADGSYSYSIATNMEEVRKFYLAVLPNDGWENEVDGFTQKGSGSVGVFEKSLSTLFITIVPNPDGEYGVVVMMIVQ